MLRLDAEEECGSKCVHVGDACFVESLSIGVGVAMGGGHRVPHERKAQPREQEIHGEHEKRPAPLSVHQRGEDVLQIAAPSLGHVR